MLRHRLKRHYVLLCVTCGLLSNIINEHELYIQESATVGKGTIDELKLNERFEDVESLPGKDDEDDKHCDAGENGGHYHLYTEPMNHVITFFVGFIYCFLGLIPKVFEDVH